jgi:hypothetical protein
MFQNYKIVIEQGDWFKDLHGELRLGKYWYFDSNGLIFQGDDGKTYTHCSFIKSCEGGIC